MEQPLIQTKWVLVDENDSQYLAEYIFTSRSNGRFRLFSFPEEKYAEFTYNLSNEILIMKTKSMSMEWSITIEDNVMHLIDELSKKYQLKKIEY